MMGNQRQMLQQVQQMQKQMLKIQEGAGQRDRGWQRRRRCHGDYHRPPQSDGDPRRAGRCRSERRGECWKSC